jgi:hypothetical protein
MCLPGAAEAQEKEQERAVVADTVTGPVITFRIRLDQILSPKCKCQCEIPLGGQDSKEVVIVELEGIADDATCAAQDGKTCTTEDGDEGELDFCEIKWEPGAGLLLQPNLADFKLELDQEN